MTDPRLPDRSTQDERPHVRSASFQTSSSSVSQSLARPHSMPCDGIILRHLILPLWPTYQLLLWPSNRPTVLVAFGV
jgi:hypothetical protein